VSLSERPKLYGILAVPGFIVIVGESLHFIEDVYFVRQHFGWVADVAEQLLPSKTNTPALILGIAWAIGFLFVVPPLAKRYGIGKALFIVATPIIVAALLMGALEAQKAIDDMNRQDRIKQEQARAPK
jgi:hypothetical protein